MKNWLNRNYHWVIAAVALLQLFSYGGLVNNFSGYHLIPVCETLGLTRTEFALANTTRSFVAIFGNLFSGALIGRIGYRRSAALCLILAMGANILFASMSAYWMLVAGCVCMGLCGGICGAAGISQLINLWFHRRRGAVLGVITGATGLGSAVLGFVQAILIENYTWRYSFLFAAFALLISALLMALLVRDTPQEKNLAPYGEGEIAAKKRGSAAWEGLQTEQLKKHPGFFIMAFCCFLSCLCVYIIQHNLVPFLQDYGYTAVAASGVYGTMMLVLTGIKFGVGVLCDAITAKRVTLIAVCCCTVGTLMMILLPKAGVWPYAASIIYAFSIPLLSVLVPLLGAELFGYRAQAHFVGVFMAMVSASNMVESFLSNRIYDVVGSYIPVYWGAAFGMVALMGVYSVLFTMMNREKKKIFAAGGK